MHSFGQLLSLSLIMFVSGEQNKMYSCTCSWKMETTAAGGLDTWAFHAFLSPASQLDVVCCVVLFLIVRLCSTVLLMLNRKIMSALC